MFYNLQVSYLIVDEAITDLKMEEDPFTVSGQEIPSELPYNDDEVQNKNLNTKLNHPRVLYYSRSRLMWSLQAFVITLTKL